MRYYRQPPGAPRNTDPPRTCTRIKHLATRSARASTVSLCRRYRLDGSPASLRCLYPRRADLTWRLTRAALMGCASTGVADVVSNSVRVVKVPRAEATRSLLRSQSTGTGCQHDHSISLLPNPALHRSACAWNLPRMAWLAHSKFPSPPSFLDIPTPPPLPLGAPSTGVALISARYCYAPFRSGDTPDKRHTNELCGRHEPCGSCRWVAWIALPRLGHAAARERHPVDAVCCHLEVSRIGTQQRALALIRGRPLCIRMVSSAGHVAAPE